MTGRERAKANALGLRANGLSIRQIADRLGVPRGTVAGWLRGRGEWYEVRTCELCGERFIPASGRQRFCTPQHAAKHRRVFGPPTAIDVFQQRARELEAELASLQEQLAMRRAA
jgi:Homeodomain-like domain